MSTIFCPSSKSKIFAKLRPTFGDESNNLVNSVGAGVARVSPVAVRTTPFMAEGRKATDVGRTTGVSRAAIRIDVGIGLGVGRVPSFRRR